MTLAIQQTAETLARISVGQRLWFALSPDHGLDPGRLILTSLADDPSMSELERQLDPETLRTERVLLGVATVGARGTLTFGAPGIEGDDLGKLVRWAQRHSSNHPPLTRLRGTTLINVDQEGAIRGRYEDVSTWSKHGRSMPLPGSPQDGAHIIDRCPPEEELRYWMTDLDVSERPALVVTSKTHDPAAQELLRRVQILRGEGTEVSGIARLLTSGRLVLTTNSSIEDAMDVLTRLRAAFPEQLGQRLAACSLMQTQQEQVVKVLEASVLPTIDSSLSRLERLGEGEVAYYLYTEAFDAGPLLYVADEPAQLRPFVAHQPAGARENRGRVRLHTQGWLLFTSRHPFERFVPTLVDWAFREWGNRRDVARLRGARFQVLDDEGTVLHRERDDDLWNVSLPR